MVVAGLQRDGRVKGCRRDYYVPRLRVVILFVVVVDIVRIGLTKIDKQI